MSAIQRDRRLGGAKTHSHMLILSTSVPGIKRCGFLNCKVAGRVEPPAPAVQGSPTSEAAARTWTLDKMQTKKSRILAAIAEAPYGLTDLEGQERTGIPGDTYRVRRGELYREGQIKRAQKTRLTKSGNDAEVWCVV